MRYDETFILLSLKKKSQNAFRVNIRFSRGMTRDK